MRLLIWHVHGSWMTNFVSGQHTYLVPVDADRGPEGRGRALTWEWPTSVVEVTPEQIATEPIDVVIVQSARELELATLWMGGRRPGTDVPLVWLEHNAPQGRINEMRHPAADRADLTLVHVTATNALFWDSGHTPSCVIDHGVLDPGDRWTGDVAASAVVVNEPVRRWRVVGTDLLPSVARAAPLDVYGIGVTALLSTYAEAPWLRVHEDVPQAELHGELARRSCYVHPIRWTSLGLALIEAMLLGMPVVALATTEAHDAVPAGTGVVSNDVDSLVASIKRLHVDRQAAEEMGAQARAHALERFSITRFHHAWDQLLEEVST
jgi:glycosyltransferase involved in cell wall biosynthesis